MAFTIEEIDVQNPIRVVLDDTLAPFGRPHDQAAFDDGGSVEHDTFRPQGARAPIFHTKSEAHNDLVVEGRFNDSRHGAGYGKATKATILRIKQRQNMVSVSWDGETWIALLKEASFGREGAGHMTYKMEFAVARGPDQPENATQPQPRGDADSVAVVRSALQAMRPKPLLADRPAAATVAEELAEVESALDQVQGAVENMAAEQQRQASTVRRVLSLVTQAQDAAESALSVVGNMSGLSALSSSDAASQAEWLAYRHEGVAVLQQILVCLQAVKQEARNSQSARPRLYRVRENDTLETIARNVFGSSAMANTLGVRADELIPGRLIRVET